MRCPHCGSNVPDDSGVCPACHANLDATAMLPRLQGSYCPSCGSLVPEGSPTCPKCGMWIPQARRSFVPRKPAPAPEHQKTGTIPRIESAIPAEQDIKDPYLHEKPLRLRAVILAAIAAIVLMGGAVLLITHPWNPEALETRAKEPADTSQAGFPGTIDSLKGQDTVRGQEGEVKSGDETTYEKLDSAYKAFGEYAQRLDESVKTLEETGFSGDADARQDGMNKAVQLGVEISNTISEVQNADVTSGTYESAKDDLLKIGNYLRNRSDVVSKAWKEAASSADPEAERSNILSAVRGDGASFANLFRGAYSSFSIEPPAEASAGEKQAAQQSEGGEVAQ